MTDDTQKADVAYGPGPNKTYTFKPRTAAEHAEFLQPDPEDILPDTAPYSERDLEE